jgi:hypothetical protein
MIFPRLGNGNIAPLRRITYLAGNKDPATGAWLGPWGEGSSIQLGPAIWFDQRHRRPADDEIVVRAWYTVRDPSPTNDNAIRHCVFPEKRQRADHSDTHHRQQGADG